jgi:hypothetical protein
MIIRRQMRRAVSLAVPCSPCVRRRLDFFSD